MVQFINNSTDTTEIRMFLYSLVSHNVNGILLFRYHDFVDEHTLSFVIKCTYLVVQKNISDISNLQAISRLLVVLKSLHAFKRLQPDVIGLYNDASLILSEKMALMNTPSSSVIERSVDESSRMVPSPAVSSPPAPPVPTTSSVPPTPPVPPVPPKAPKPKQSKVKSSNSLSTSFKRLQSSPHVRVSFFQFSHS